MSEKFRHALAQLAPSPELETALSTYQFAAEAICGIATKNTTRNGSLIANDLGAVPATSLDMVKVTKSDTVDPVALLFLNDANAAMANNN